jgi:hypothetical protein
MRVDAGSSRLLSAQVHEDFHAQTAFDAVVRFLRESSFWTKGAATICLTSIAWI